MRVTRYKENDIGTWGELEFDDFKCYTFEPCGEETTLRGRDRRIPQGRYDMRWHNSPRFQQRLPHLYNDEVPMDRYILIHSGNYAKDTEGCILLGKRVCKHGVLESKPAVKEFIDKLENGDIDEYEFEIVNAFRNDE